MPQELINGYRMHYEVYGEGQPLVMIHGGLGGGEGCRDMVEHHASRLADRFRLIFYDRRSAGRSETPGDGYGLENQVHDLRSLLDHLGVTYLHVLGSSAGGPIAIGLAMDYPGMVNSLLLVNTMSYASENERKARRDELDGLLSNEATLGREAAVEKALEARQPTLRSDDPLRFRRLRDINVERFDGITNSIRAYLAIGDRLESRLREITMPTMIVHGDADTIIPVTCAIELHQAIDGSELHIAPRAGHGLMTNESTRMGNLIQEFVEELAASTRSTAGADS